jgi:putative intracellular protease/amidase
MSAKDSKGTDRRTFLQASLVNASAVITATSVVGCKIGGAQQHSRTLEAGSEGGDGYEDGMVWDHGKKRPLTADERAMLRARATPWKEPDAGVVPATTEKPVGARGRVGVLVEHHFDPYEYRDFRIDFPAAGFEVHFISHLWGNAFLPFESNVENITITDLTAPGVKATDRWHHRYFVNESVKAERCLTPEAAANQHKNFADPNDYDAIILIGAMAMDQLRYVDQATPNGPNESPAVAYIRRIMESNKARRDGKQGAFGHEIKVAAICHSLWLLTGSGLLKGRNVTCGHNLIGDVKNAGGVLQWTPHGKWWTMI